MDKVEISCKRCGQRLRVPSELGDIAVTCPKCRHRWDESGSLLKKLAVAAATGFVYKAGAQAATAADLFGTGAPAAAASSAPAAAATAATGADVVAGAATDASGDFWDVVGEILGGLFGS